MKKSFALILLLSLFILLSGCDNPEKDKQLALQDYKQDVVNLVNEGNTKEEADNKLAIDKPLYVKLGFISPTKEPSNFDSTPIPTTKTPIKEDVSLIIDGEPEEMFNIGNIYAVFNGGKEPVVELKKNYYVTSIINYHWNDAKGKEPGTISLKDENGKIYGPWVAITNPGQGGVPNAYWIVSPNINLLAGKYTVIDSDPATWSQNEQSGGQGMTWAKGIPENY